MGPWMATFQPADQEPAMKPETITEMAKQLGAMRTKLGTDGWAELKSGIAARAVELGDSEAGTLELAQLGQTAEVIEALDAEPIAASGGTVAKLAGKKPVLSPEAAATGRGRTALV